MSHVYKVDDEITLRTFEPTDAESLYRVIDTNREAIKVYMRWAEEVTGVDWVKTQIDRWHEMQSQTGCLCLGIQLQGDLVGAVYHLRPDTVNNLVELGYWLAASARGRGVAVRAVRKLLNVTFDELGFNRVNIRVSPCNKSSLALAERLGLKPEGVSREAWKVGDEYWDAVEFGVLSAEWDGGAASVV